MYIILCTQESQLLAPLVTKNTVSGHSHCTGSMENRAGGSETFGLDTKWGEPERAPHRQVYS